MIIYKVMVGSTCIFQSEDELNAGMYAYLSRHNYPSVTVKRYVIKK